MQVNHQIVKGIGEKKMQVTPKKMQVIAQKGKKIFDFKKRANKLKKKKKCMLSSQQWKPFTKKPVIDKKTAIQFI